MVLEETMASKVCPVCKTFTSSSNTTLNAHIDQCLCGESTIKITTNWTETWTVKKKRVTYKPRKTRSMLDICKTAPSCNLEELERRNNDTNWATDLSVPTQHIEIHGEEQENEQGGLDDNVMETDQDEGAVNINSDGMENQILCAPKIGAEDDHGSQKRLRRSHRSSSPKPLCDFEMESDHEENFSVDEEYQKEDAPEQSFESEEGLELDDAEPWECTRNLPVESPVENDETSLENRSFSRTLSSSDTPISSDEPEDDEYVDHHPLIKRVARRFRSSASKKRVELRGQSSRKKVMCVSQKSVPELRSGLKRKFSDLKETLTNVGPSRADHLQDSSAHVSQMIEEITGTGTGIETSQEQALTVLPSNTIMDSLADEEESSEKETEVHEEGPTIEPNSLNSESHSQNSIVVYQGPCSEPEMLTLSSQPVVDDGEMIVGEDVDETMNDQTNCEITELEDNEIGNGVGFLEVEPIHISNPPVSFLLSPGADMGSEDVQGNSSLTDSRVQASEERLDLILEDVQWNSSLTNGRVQSSEEPLDLVSEDVQGNSSLTNNRVKASGKRLDLVSKHVQGNSSLTNCRVLSSEDPLDLVSEHLQENLPLANSKVRSPQDPRDLVSKDVKGKPSLTNSRGQSPEDPLDLVSEDREGNPSLTNSRGQTPDGRLVLVSEDVQGNTSLTNNRIQSSEDPLDLVSEEVQGNPSLANSRGQSSEGRLVLLSEDVQGNTSLTNNRVQSSEPHLDLVDQDSILESPISTTPTNTNPTLTVRSIAAIEENPVQQEANMVEETTEATLPENSVAPTLTNDHQPFMEGMAQSFTSLYQVSALLKIRRSIWNNHPVNYYFDLENNSSTTGHVPMTTPTDSTAAASPSSSNHVLRLMGKDLMVANKDQVVNNASFPVVPVSREMMINASTPAMRNGNVLEGSSLFGAVSREMMNTSSGMCNRVPESSVVGVCSAPGPAHQRSTTT